jgi:hypothetical protein
MWMFGSMLTGLLGNLLVFSPLVTVVQGRLTHRVLVSVTDDVANSLTGYQVYYEDQGKSEKEATCNPSSPPAGH